MLYRLGVLSASLLLATTVPIRAQDNDPTIATEPPRASATMAEGFETERPSWRQEDADSAIRLLVHERSERARHAGQRSERFVFTSEGPGSSFYYSYPLPEIPLTEDLEITLFVRANQPGVQLQAQVILPADTDPDTGRPSFVRVSGSSLNTADRWQRLEMSELLTSVERQVRLKRFQTRRPISLEGAYLDRVVVNLYAGGGDTEVFLDDLRISPVPNSAILALAPELEAINDPSLPQLPAGERAAGAGAVARIGVNAGRLSRDDRDWLPSVLRAPGADLDRAIPFGFDVVSVPIDEDPARLEQAARQGALLMPDLGSLGSEELQPPDAATAIEAIAGFPMPDLVAFWELGSALGSPRLTDQRRAAQERAKEIMDSLRGADEGRAPLATATVANDFAKFAMPGQSLDLIGVDPLSWGGSRDPNDVFEYFKQRRDLTVLWNVNAPFWSWVDAAVPARVKIGVWGTDAPPGWGLARVQPEQVRLTAYLALMAGFKGIGYKADAELTRDGGRPLLYEMSLLNAEMDLVEPILARGADPIQYLETYPPDPTNLTLIGGVTTQSGLSRISSNIPKEKLPHPSIKAAAISTQDGRGRLVLIADLQSGAQWQPGQMAFNDLTVVVPGAPSASQAFEVRLGGGRWLERDRVPGGVRFTLPEFGVATMVLLTTDINQGEQIRAQIERIRPRVVDLALKQARQQLETAADINGRLALDGKITRDSADLLALASRSLDSAEQARAREDYELAWDEARRVTRPLRLLMRAHFDLAYLRMVEATASQRDRAAGLPPLPPAPPEGQLPPKDPYEQNRKLLPRVLVQATASPPLVAWQTLPQHYIWCDWVEKGVFSTNLVDGGDFDGVAPQALFDSGWSDSSHQDPRVTYSMRLVEAKQKGDAGRGQVLKLSVLPDGGEAPPAFLDQPAAAVQTPPIAVKARQFLRISALVKLPRGLPPGAGGLIVRDSLGGEELQYRAVGTIADWSLVTLYRRVPSDGMLTVTLGLAGVGEAYFDDVRVERLEDFGGGELARGAAPVARPAPLPTANLPAENPGTAQPASGRRRLR